MPCRRRYHDTEQGAFLGDLAYERVLERHGKHFLVVLDRLFHWEAMSEEMIRLYKGRGEVGDDRPIHRCRSLRCCSCRTCTMCRSARSQSSPTCIC